MNDKRPYLALAALALLAACGEEPADDGRAASGEVLEGTISDAMLPLDRVRSQPPLEDPEAFQEVQREAVSAGGQAAPAAAEDESPAEEPAEDAEEAPADEPPAEPED